MWIDLAQEKNKWSALVNTVMNPRGVHAMRGLG